MIGKQFNKDRVALVFITILTVIAVVYGFTIVPSPIKARGIAYDHQRVVDLGNLQTAIDTYYSNNGNLPQSLNDLPSTSADQTVPVATLNKSDPETKKPYEYQIIDDSNYKLCANFATDSTKEDPNTYDSNNPDYSSYMNDFKHKVGYKCFNENENATGSNDSPVPTMTCLGNCPTTPTPIPATGGPTGVPLPAHAPSVVLSSLDSVGTCKWTPTFTLTGFAPNSNITVSSYGTLSDQCDPNKTHGYSWNAQWSQQTDANGDITIIYSQNDYGDYTYSFSDSSGNSATIHYKNGPTTGPTIVPANGGGGSAG